MPRPTKKRRICTYPRCSSFSPDSVKDEDCVIMTLDEYETIRLIDFEQITQEECAAQMNMARTSVQAIYSSARTKLAQCIVNAAVLRIEGGNYTLCEGNSPKCKKRLEKEKCLEIIKNRRKLKMNIAVTYENGEVFQHFGHCENFKVFEVESNEIKSEKIINSMGNGHGALAGFLKENNIDTLICGGIGGGARTALAQAGIELYPGVSGDADEAVKALISGNLNYNPDTVCQHHHHGEGHSCGEDKHGCGGN